MCYFLRYAKDALDEDPVIRGRPVVLQSKDGHAAWVSKTILQWCGSLLGDVEGGVVARDARGNPTGSSDPQTASLVSHSARRITRQCTAMCEEAHPDRR